jgi:hypothetical protein
MNHQDDSEIATRRVAAEPTSAEPSVGQRREAADRRQRVWWSIVYGNIKPRRRAPPRRLDHTSYHSVDWHSAHLLVIAIAISLMSVADAFLTLMLLQGGAAEEANPVMNLVVHGDPLRFAVLKMAMTGCSVVLMVCLARYRFMRVFRVELALYAILAAYTVLIAYELWMVSDSGLGSLSDF